MSLKPVGDVFMVEVGEQQDPGGLMKTGHIDPDEGVRGGKVVGICSREDLTHFGFVTFMFDSSLMNTEVLDKLYDHFKKYVGKTVHWGERSESGTIIESEGKQYAFVKWSAITAVEDN